MLPPRSCQARRASSGGGRHRSRGARLVGVNGIVVEHLGFNDVAKILSQVGHGTLRYLQESLTVPAAAYGVMTEHSVAGPLGGRKDLELSLRRSPILYRLELMYV
jgi:hypothetical protein